MYDLLNTNPQSYWSIALSVLSAVLAVVSVAVSVAALRQNCKMIETSSRPYVGVSMSESAVFPRVVDDNYFKNISYALQTITEEIG